jgi:hypothetical protein
MQTGFAWAGAGGEAAFLDIVEWAPDLSCATIRTSGMSSVAERVFVLCS